MTHQHTDEPAPRKPLRLWPGVAAGTLQAIGWLVVPAFVPGMAAYGMLAGVAGGLVILVWWLFFSRAAWTERLGAIALAIVAVFATSRLVHESIANGMMGFMLVVYAIPALTLALVVGAAAGRGRSVGLRLASMAGAILLACTALTLIRTGGLAGDGQSDLHWRWTPTPEERLLARGDDGSLESARDRSLDSARGRDASSSAPAAPGTDTRPQGQANDEPAARPSAPPGTAQERVAHDNHEPAALSTDPTRPNINAAWPGFRGPERDSVIRGVRIETDWSRSPPVELWRRAIGPGWSSFAVDTDLVYTQEQRGDDELVSAYNLKTGAPVWRHRDTARFWESNGGAGPRATPTLDRGRLYALGGTGILNALDAHDGSVVWSRNAVSDTGAKVPDWGIASSPIAIGDLVVAAAAGSLAAYDAATGKPRWFGPTGGYGYSSPHLATIDGVAQIVLINGPGAIGVAPSDGALLWKHTWAGDAIVQPALIAGADLLIGSGSGLSNTGMLRLTVGHESAGWMVKERWISKGLKPYFNDFVVHEGHVFGFDGGILACIDLEDGVRRWKGGRYGHGQFVLLPDQDLLLVLSEDGELALVGARPDAFTEVARFKALDGKTWNHPVLAGDVLLVRNGEEMAAFRLSLEDRR